MKKRMQKMFLVVLYPMIIITLILAEGAMSAAMACDYYASPTGTGNGSSPSSPFRVSQFWPVARPGSTLCLLDGEYTGSGSMIKPPQNLRGTSTARITIKALNDGKVTINGQHSNAPVQLYYNDYFVLEGFNAHSSNGTVISIASSNNNIVRRVAAWDAHDGNANIFGIHGSNYNLLEDVAGWGVARKTFSASQGGNFTTIRRAWGRWEGSHVVGPKMTYTLAYRNYSMICENCIGAWSGERMKETYTLLNYLGNAWTGPGAATYTDHSVNQAYGIFAMDALERDKNAKTKLLGSIAYVQAKDRFRPGRLVMFTKIDSIEVANTVAYVEPGSHTTRKTFGLSSLPLSLGGPARNLVARNITGIGGDSADIHSEWQGNDRAYGANVGSVPNIFGAPGSGARICYRYKDGVLTNEPLWPWPMNQRIIEATAKSGRAPVDVTALIEKMFGSIPAACKGGSTTVNSPPTVSTLPSAPMNLQATP